MIMALTGLFFLAMAIVFIRRIEWGLYALLFALPFERIGSWPLNLTTGHPVIRLSQVVGAAVIAAFLARLAIRKQKLHWSWWFLPLLLLAVWAVIPVIAIGYHPLLYGYASLLFVIALTIVVANLVPEVNREKMFLALIAGATVSAVFGLYQFIGGALGLPDIATGLREQYSRAVFGYPRIQSTALEPLYYADYLLIPIFVAGALYLFKAAKKRARLVPILGVLILTFLLTMSRGAFLAAIVAAIVVIPIIVVRHTKINFGGIAKFIGAAVVVGFILLGLSSLLAQGSFIKGPERFATLVTVDLTDTGSFTQRTTMRDQAVSLASGHLVYGVGIEGITPYALHYPHPLPETTVAYNNQFLELIDQVGIPGMIMFYTFLVAMLWMAYKMALKEKVAQTTAWLVGLIAAVVAMTIQAQSFSGYLLTHLWVAYGLIAGFVLFSNGKRREAR